MWTNTISFVFKKPKNSLFWFSLGQFTFRREYRRNIHMFSHSGNPKHASIYYRSDMRSQNTCEKYNSAVTGQYQIVTSTVHIKFPTRIKFPLDMPQCPLGEIFSVKNPWCTLIVLSTEASMLTLVSYKKLYNFSAKSDRKRMWFVHGGQTGKRIPSFTAQRLIRFSSYRVRTATRCCP